MTQLRTRLAQCLTGFALTLAPATYAQTSAPEADHPGPAQALARPAPFVSNTGQWSHDAAFVAEHGPTTLFLEEDGWTLLLEERKPASHDVDGTKPAVAVRIAFADDARGKLVPEKRLPGHHNYFLGSDPRRWRSQVPLWSSVRYEEVRDGIDVRMRRHQAGHFEYDLLLQPDAQLEDIAFEVEGAEDLRLDEDGGLILDTALGPVRMPVPVSWEEGCQGARRSIECRYVLEGDDRFGFEALEARQAGWSLVVDPGLIWMTYFGGTGDDGLGDCGLDANGNITIIGWTRSNDMPTTAGAFQPTRGSVGTAQGSEDIFAARLTPDGTTLLWSTYLGGNGTEFGSDLVVHPNGECTIAAYTTSSNFPTTAGAFQRNLAGGADVFVTRLAADGRSLVWSTLLGSAQEDTLAGIAVDSLGVTTVCGRTSSTVFPGTSGGFGGGRNDGFVAQVAADGSALLWSRYIGGSNTDSPVEIALDPQEQTAYVHGVTYSVDFPTTTGAFQTTYAGGRTDRFVVRVDRTGGNILAATLIGGSNDDFTTHGDIAVDVLGQVVLCGPTLSADFPVTAGAFQTTSGGDREGFVARMNDTLTTLQWSTFLGTSDRDNIRGIDVDAQRNVTFTGFTRSSSFPTTPGAWQRTAPGGGPIVGRLSADGSTLQYGTYFGNSTGSSADVVLDAQGDAICLGQTASAGWPTTPGVVFPSHQGNFDGILFKISLQPASPPTLTGISPNQVSIGSAQTITLSGTSLVDVQGVTVSGVAVSSANYQSVSSTQLDFTLPASVVIGPNQPVVVTTGTGSASIGLDVTGAHPPILTAPPGGLRGVPQTYSVVGEQGWLSVWGVSLDLIPSVLPGIVSLGIGNDFTTIYVVDQTTNDALGTSTTSVIYPTLLSPGSRVHMQVVTLDPAMLVVPLEVSNIGSTTLF